MYSNPNMTHRNRDALFGGRSTRSSYGPLPTNDDNNAAQTRNLMEQQNNKELAFLHSQVSRLKEVTLDINSTIVSQNKELSEMGNQFDSTGSLLGNTIKKMGVMLSSGGSNHMIYLALFIVFMFLLIYWSMKPR